MHSHTLPPPPRPPTTGLEVIVSGYNHKLVLLLEKVLEKMLNFTITDELFDRLLDKCKRKYVHERMQQASEYAIENCTRGPYTIGAQ
jgi:insulysin